MLGTSSEFNTLTSSPRRKLHKRALISFEKTYQSTTQFFTVGISAVGGPDPIFGTGAVLQEWDKYDYEDYSDRVMHMEVTREMDLLGSVIQAMADVDFKNTDHKFTPGRDLVIGDFIIPKRPMKLFWGFDNEAVPMFTGVTEKIPRIERGEGRAGFHAKDFIDSIFNIELDQAVMYIDQSTDQILSSLLIDHAELAASQFVLDAGMNTIPFAYFKKGDKLGPIIQKLMEAELGQFFQDELGMFRFWNRQHTLFNTPVWSFNQDNIISEAPPSLDPVINVVEVKSLVRAIQAKQKIWESPSSVEVPAGGSVNIWADFSDDYGDLPVTTVDIPQYVATATTSSYETNTSQLGDGANNPGDIALTYTAKFATAYLMTFTNSGGVPMFIRNLQIYGVPAKVITEIYHREADSASVSKYDELVYRIENDFIQTETFAQSFSKKLIEDFKDPARVKEINARAVPHLQLGDIVNYDDGEENLEYRITRIAGKFSTNGGATQKIRLVNRVTQTYFQVGVSFVGGPDVIAP